MTAAEADPRLTRLVSSALPAGTRWHVYDRRLRSPMNLVLDEVARQLEREFVLIWVDGGPPDVFVLTSPERIVTVWSTRHLELSAVFRALLVDDAWSAVRVELAERLVLKVVAELSLRDGDSEVAAKCLLGAVVGQQLTVADSEVMADLDVADPARMDEAYMALWFMGLAHEFGHGLPATGAIDTGLAHAMRFAYDPAVPADRLLDQLRAQRGNDAAFGLARIQARSFCALAASRRGQSRALDAVVELLG